MNVSGVSVKEVVEMIESRIPGGRYVISILLCLLILTATTACGAYLYHTLLLPVTALITTGHVAATTVGGMIGSIIGTIILLLGGSYMQRSIVSNYGKILANDEKHARDLNELLEIQEDNRKIRETFMQTVMRSMELLEARVASLEKQGR
jgi:membrane protein DedA with SNARE-associated domain